MSSKLQPAIARLQTFEPTYVMKETFRGAGCGGCDLFYKDCDKKKFECSPSTGRKDGKNVIFKKTN